MSRPLEKATPGMVFGRLTVVGDDAPHIRKCGRKTAKWICVCSCGKEVSVVANSLKKGRTKSCGCYNREIARITGTKKRKYDNDKRSSDIPEYITWMAMIARCEYKKHVGYRIYGGRGINVCQRWRESFNAFLEDMGRKPARDFSLDRIDNNKGYYKDNCRWATRTEQARNRSNVILNQDLADEIRRLKTDNGWGRRKIAKHLNLPMGSVVGVLQNLSWVRA